MFVSFKTKSLCTLKLPVTVIPGSILTLKKYSPLRGTSKISEIGSVRVGMSGIITSSDGSRSLDSSGRGRYVNKYQVEITIAIVRNPITSIFRLMTFIVPSTETALPERDALSEARKRVSCPSDRFSH
jgi:hypothetical protein